MKLIAAALTGFLGFFGGASAQGNSDKTLSAEQSKLLDLLERGAHHALETGDHVPVAAFVMRVSGEVNLIDLNQGFAHQGDALQATLAKLIPMARAHDIKASGIMFQPGDAGEAKPPVLIFDLEQVERPRFMITLTYSRKNGAVSFGSKTIKMVPAKLFAQQ